MSSTGRERLHQEDTGRSPRRALHLGETPLYLGQPEVGIPPLEQAIRLGQDNPNIAIAYWALGTCQLLSGRI
jgi:hypothetical protein